MKLLNILSLFIRFKKKTIKDPIEYGNYFFDSSAIISKDICRQISDLKIDLLPTTCFYIFIETLILILHFNNRAFLSIFQRERAEYLINTINEYIVYIMCSKYPIEKSLNKYSKYNLPASYKVLELNVIGNSFYTESKNYFVDTYNIRERDYSKSEIVAIKDPGKWNKDKSVIGKYLINLFDLCHIEYNRNDITFTMKWMPFIGFCSATLSGIYEMLNNAKKGKIISFN